MIKLMDKLCLLQTKIQYNNDEKGRTFYENETYYI